MTGSPRSTCTDSSGTDGASARLMVIPVTSSMNATARFGSRLPCGRQAAPPRATGAYESPLEGLAVSSPWSTSRRRRGLRRGAPMFRRGF